MFKSFLLIVLINANSISGDFQKCATTSSVTGSADLPDDNDLLQKFETYIEHSSYCIQNPKLSGQKLQNPPTNQCSNSSPETSSIPITSYQLFLSAQVCQCSGNGKCSRKESDCKEETTIMVTFSHDPIECGTEYSYEIVKVQMLTSKST